VVPRLSAAARRVHIRARPWKIPEPVPEAPPGAGLAWRAVRAVPLPVRRAVYERCRIEEEPSWYRTRSAWNQRRAHRLTLAVLAFEVVGAVGGLLRVAGISVDLSVPGGTGPG
jgi:hypothetical protein